MVIVDGDADLFEIVEEMRASCDFFRCLHRWQEQTSQNTNDSDDDQQFDQRESGFAYKC
jgi:hypothetical protein